MSYRGFLISTGLATLLLAGMVFYLVLEDQIFFAIVFGGSVTACIGIMFAFAKKALVDPHAEKGRPGGRNS